MPRKLPADGRYIFDVAGYLSAVRKFAATYNMSLHKVALELSLNYKKLSAASTGGRGLSVPVLLALFTWSGINPLDYFFDSEEGGGALDAPQPRSLKEALKVIDTLRQELAQSKQQPLP